MIAEREATLMTEMDVLKEMVIQKKQAITWFGEAGKPERERLIAKAFLRALSVSFEPEEIKSVNDEFPDVEFRFHHFEIKEMLDPGRKRHDEYKRDLEKLQKATKLRDVMYSY